MPVRIRAENIKNAAGQTDRHTATTAEHNAVVSTRRLRRSHNPDIANAHIDPLTQYRNQGWTEGRAPSAALGTNKYLNAYPDVRAAHVDPLQDYLQAGQFQGGVAILVS